MNAKGTKFLAVLAVMVMAFAAFAVINATTDAAGNVVHEVTLEKGTDITVVTEEGAALDAGTAYYIGADVSVSVGAGTYIFFVLDGKVLNIEATGGAIVGIYSAKLVGGTTSTTTSTSGTESDSLTLYVKNGIAAACLDEENEWDFPEDLSEVTSIATVDLPMADGDSAEFYNGDAVLAAAGDVEVEDGWTLAADVVLANEGDAIKLGAGSIFVGTVTFDNSVDATETTPAVIDITIAVLALKAGDDGAAITAGSIELSGEFTVEEFALAIAGEGDIVLDGVTIIASDDPDAVNGALLITADVTVQGEGLTINDGVIMTVSSTVKTEGDATIVNDGTILQDAGGDMSEAAIDPLSIGDFMNVADPDDMKTQEQKGEATQTTVYPANQVIKIVSGTTWTLVAGTEITIKGQLYVEEGAKIIIAPGAKLNITNAAIVDVLGEIVIQYEEDEDVSPLMWFGTMEVITGSINVEGAITVDGLLQLDGDQMPYGIITIDEEGIVIINASGMLVTDDLNSELNIADDASLIVYGSLDAETIYNAGMVLINSGVPATGDTVIYQMADAATVSIYKYTVYADDEDLFTVTITDAAMPISVYNYETEEYELSTVLLEDQVNSVIITPASAGVGDDGDDYFVTVKDITVIEDVDVLATIDDIVYYYNTIIVAGEVGVSISYEGDDEAAAGAKGRVTVDIDATVAAIIPEEFELSGATAGVTINNGGELIVYGDLNAVVTSGDKSTFNNNGEVTVLENGVASVRDQKMDAVINACEYIIETSTKKTYFYVSIDTALDILNTGLVDKTTARGVNTMTRSNELPAETTLTLEADSAIFIGDEEDTEVTLYVDALANIKGSNADIYVNGTMFAEDQSKVKKTVNIHSDVKTYETDAKGKEKKDGWAKWTNLTAALNAAQPGDVVTITRDADEIQEYVYVKSNTTIKDGVTLVVPAGKAPLLLFNGVTLTVNGDLTTGEDIWAETQFGVKAKRSVNYNSSAIVVNGALTSTVANGIQYADNEGGVLGAYRPMSDGAPIAGAYYSVGTTSVISSLPIAVDSVDVIAGNITINGAVTSDPVVFSKSNTCSTIVIGNGLVDTNAEVIPTILKAEIMLDGTRIISTASDAAATVGNFTGAIFAGESKISATGLSGNAGTYEIADKKDKLTLSGDATLVAGESISIDTGSVFTNAFVVDGAGTMKIATGGILEVSDNESDINKLEVSGLLYIPNGKQITVNTLTNKGTITVVPETETKAAGQLFIEDFLYDGIARSDMVAANPVINGAIDLNDGAVAFILNGMTLDDVAKEKFATYKSTEFYVEGKLWFTAYVVDNTQIDVTKAPIQNADLTNWNNKADFTGTNRGLHPNAGQDAKLYAVINYNIYDVVIYTDSGINSGIKSVEIDGIPMQWVDNNRFVLAPGTDALVAGEHTVKCTFVSGYTGTMSLYTDMGILLKDMKFQTSGTTAEDRNTVLFIKGSSQAIVPEPEPVPEKEVSEWNVTTILLLVLVILIAIMVVIVALKLRRS